MKGDMQYLGELLRSKREEKKLSLKEVENATAIRHTYIGAIEEGRVGECVASIYAQGFVKRYAAYLGYEHDDLVKQYPTLFTTPHEKYDFSYGIGTLEQRGSSGERKASWLWWVGGCVAAGLLLWVVVKAVGA